MVSQQGTTNRVSGDRWINRADVLLLSPDFEAEVHFHIQLCCAHECFKQSACLSEARHLILERKCFATQPEDLTDRLTFSIGLSEPFSFEVVPVLIGEVTRFKAPR